ncbi:DUF6492 family protein [Microbacterium sp.]|uniref:DUF6492 family protein n=1 Tax=Microbacterium sp. TaxID=51671 RepID=UPI003C73615E
MSESPGLVFVSVVFDAELELQRLQARSFARFATVDVVDEIIVIDNTVSGLRGLRRSRLLSDYGRHSDRVVVVRTKALAVDRGADGWRSQQAAKLLVSRRIHSQHYVVLDAKNHFVRDITVADFIDGSGTPRGGRHSYEGHPLRDDLGITLRGLGMDEARITAASASFPVTATPFVMITDAVRASIDDLERRTGLPFATAFERQRMLEFFYYSGWMTLHRPQQAISNGEAIEAPVVWGSDPSPAAVQRAIELVRHHDAPVMGVHRRAMMRSPADARALLVEFWASRDLLNRPQGHALITRFRRAYRPAMVITRLVERLRRSRG